MNDQQQEVAERGADPPSLEGTATPSGTPPSAPAAPARPGVAPGAAPIATPAPEDPIAYRIAVGAVGAALVAFLIGAAVIAAGGKPVPTQYWTSGSAIAGALLGILAPTPKSPRKQQTPPTPKTAWFDKVKAALGEIVLAVTDLWANRALLILLFVFLLSIVFAITSNSAQLAAVAAASGGALIGLLAPPPGTTTAGGQ
ncbi:MAG: hypothetical protein JOY58_09565 [Solirubrobacterales bacterium]|nr:hypothetical protein [Solirubrobacterales bacterium]MBV9048504.1 hypothetical protein [Solirubrobacterales bacterium]